MRMISLFVSKSGWPFLGSAGYYVFPIELVSDVFKQEGIQDTEALINTDPRKFGEAFGADAALYVTINKWDTNYYVVGGNVKVGVSFVLKSTKTGSTLWNYSDELTVDTTSNSSGGGLIGLAVNMVATAVSTAMTDYVPIAKKKPITWHWAACRWGRTIKIS